MPDYRGGDIDLRSMRTVALCILAAIVIAILAAGWLLHARGPAANTPPHPFNAPAPLLQPAPQPDRVGYFEEKRRITEGYGWIDRQAGIARIPLAEAMRLTAARARKPADGARR